MTPIFFLLVLVVLLFAASWVLVGIATLFWYALVGLVIGFFGRLLVKDTAGLGMLRTVLAGLAGSIGGGMIADALDVGGLVSWIIVVLVAAIVVALFARRR
ncbi:MAG: hypothetical protein ABI200_08030 [Gaiellales bacterium]